MPVVNSIKTPGDSRLREDKKIDDFSSLKVIIIIMGVSICDSKLVMMIKPKTICLDLTKKVDNNLKH